MFPSLPACWLAVSGSFSSSSLGVCRPPSPAVAVYITLGWLEGCADKPNCQQILQLHLQSWASGGCGKPLRRVEVKPNGIFICASPEPWGKNRKENRQRRLLRNLPMMGDAGGGGRVALPWCAACVGRAVPIAAVGGGGMVMMLPSTFGSCVCVCWHWVGDLPAILSQVYRG